MTQLDVALALRAAATGPKARPPFGILSAVVAASPSQPPGPAVDAQGRTVVDPTQNVLDLVNAAIKRQDDLREMASMHNREMSAFRTEFDDKLRKAESDRIDAIRAVDVGAVAAAASVQATQATTLAAQVATSADALRNQVAAAASAQTTALAAALDPIQKDIADLRRAQYEAQGKSNIVENPLKSEIELLMGRLIGIEQRQVGGQEQRTETRATIGAGQAIIGIVLAIIAALGLYLGVKSSDAVTPAQLQSNAPYVADKPTLDASIARLQAQVTSLLAAKK